MMAVGGIDPAEIIVLGTKRDSVILGLAKHEYANYLALNAVNDRAPLAHVKWFPGCDGEAGFLADFAGQSVKEGLAGLEATANEAILASLGVGSVSGSFASNEDVAGGINNEGFGGHLQHGLAHGRGSA